MRLSGEAIPAAGSAPVQSRTSTLSWARRLLEREASLGIILMVPGMLLLMVFMAYPFFLGIWLSLTNSMIGRMGRFMGLRNFTDLLGDSIFLRTAQNTFVYALMTVPFKAALGLGLALALNKRMRFGNGIRAMVMMPWIVPTALSSLGWFMIFDPVFSPISWLLRHLGLIHENINFLGDPWRSPRCVLPISGGAFRFLQSSSWPGYRQFPKSCSKQPRSTGRASGSDSCASRCRRSEGWS